MGVFTSWQQFSSISVLLGVGQGRGRGWRWKRWNVELRVQTSMWNVNCALTDQHVKVSMTREFFLSVVSACLVTWGEWKSVSFPRFHWFSSHFINPHKPFLSQIGNLDICGSRKAHAGTMVAPGFPAVVGEDACSAGAVSVCRNDDGATEVTTNPRTTRAVNDELSPSI